MTSELSFPLIYYIVLEIIGILVYCVRVLIAISCRSAVKQQLTQSPCRSPVITRNISHNCVCITVLVASSYNDLITSINRLSVLHSFKTRHRPPCQTRQNALLKSTNMTEFLRELKTFSNNSLKLDICSVVLLCE